MYFCEGTAIEDLAYELYKVDWMRSISAKRQAKALKNWYKETDEEEREDYTFEDYLDEVGFDGEIYACYDEFLDNEYQDEEYMQKLLGSKKLFAEYLKSLEE